MKYLDNFLYSGHTFSEDENLEKFRFLLLNILMVINLFFTALGIISSLLGSVRYSSLFLIILSIYLLFSLYLFVLLRKKKKYYSLAAGSLILGMLVLFYNVLFVHTEDEFRLIAFFFLLLTTFSLLGKKYGLFLGIFLFISIYIISNTYPLNVTDNAMKTFFSFLFAFSIFLFVFIDKVEKDANEFKILNYKLEDKVNQEMTQRLEQEKMLLRQCRMANMGEMIDAIAHQWRQPLMNINAVLMNIDILGNNEKKDEKLLEEYIDEIANLTGHMSQTIEDFRTLYQEKKEKSRFEVYTLIENVLLLMKNNFHDIKVHLPSKSDIVVVNNKNELSQVFITLFSNAIEVLHLREVADKEIFIDLKQNDIHTLITIEDNAGGILEKNIYNVFDPYFTTKKQTGGTGLGLYITQIIVEHNMHGSISVSNTMKGAKFLIALPKNNML